MRFRGVLPGFHGLFWLFSSFFLVLKKKNREQGKHAPSVAVCVGATRRAKSSNSVKKSKKKPMKCISNSDYPMLPSLISFFYSFHTIKASFFSVLVLFT